MKDVKTWGFNTPPFENVSKKKKIIITSIIIVVIAVIVFLICFKSCNSKKDNKAVKKVDNTTCSKKIVAANDKDSDMYDPENMDLINEDVGVNINAGNLVKQSGKANGIDVSKWQGKINWQSVKNSGINFAIIRIGFRAGNGKIYKDSYADYNIQQAEKAGVLVGVYFYSTAISKEEAKQEAQWVTSEIAGYPISYPVVYDCEGFNSPDSRMYDVNKSKRTDIALAFLNSVKKAGYEGMLYSSKSELENSSSWDTERIDKSYKVWVAQYSQTPYPQKKTPDYGGKYSMWQYTNRGQVPNINGNTDLIVSYFTRSKAKPKDPSARVANVAAPKQNSKIYKSANDSVTAKEITNLRQAPTTKSNIVGTLKKGKFLTRTGVGSNGWSKLTYNGKTVYAVSNYLTTDSNYVISTTKSNIVDGQYFTPTNEKVTAKELTNLRNKPSTSGTTVVASIKNGQYATRLGIGDKGWSKLNYKGKICYAITSYLTNSATNTTQSTTAAQQKRFTDVNERVTAKNETNLRSSPSSKDESNVVVRLKNGDYVTRTGIDNRGWSRINYKGQTVYAVTSYLTK